MSTPPTTLTDPTEPLRPHHLRNRIATALDTLPHRADTQAVLTTIVSAVIDTLLQAGVPIALTDLHTGARELDQLIPAMSPAHATLAYTREQMRGIGQRLDALVDHPSLGPTARVARLWTQQIDNTLASGPMPPSSPDTTAVDPSPARHDPLVSTADRDVLETLRTQLTARVQILRAHGIIPTLGIAHGYAFDSPTEAASRLMTTAARDANIDVHLIYPNERPRCVADHGDLDQDRSFATFNATSLGHWMHSLKVRGLCGMLHTLASNNTVHGIILLPPLPPGLQARHDMAPFVPPGKDVSGLRTDSLQRLLPPSYPLTVALDKGPLTDVFTDPTNGTALPLARTAQVILDATVQAAARTSRHHPEGITA
jgi:hypothetical protein